MQNNINSNHWRTTAGWSNFLRFRLFLIPNQLCYISRRWCSCMHYHVSCRQIANLSPEGAFRNLRNTPSGEGSANGCCIYCFAPPPKKNVAIGIIILVILLIITTSLICVRWSQKRYSLTLGNYIWRCLRHNPYCQYAFVSHWVECTLSLCTNCNRSIISIM